jgi:hypothetical protein
VKTRRPHTIAFHTNSDGGGLGFVFVPGLSDLANEFGIDGLEWLSQVAFQERMAIRERGLRREPSEGINRGKKGTSFLESEGFEWERAGLGRRAGKDHK